MKKNIKLICSVFNFFFYLLMFLILFFVIYNFISIKVLKKDYPNLFGYALFEVISGSMSPSIEKGDLIVVDVDSGYNEGDIITFISDGAFITHRVIDIDDNVVITRGDANNSVDNPVSKDKIIGKVLKIIPNFGLWIKILTTPKVTVSIVITIFLIMFSFSYIKDDKEKIEEHKKVEEMEAKINDKKLLAKLIILFILLIILAFLIPFTLSRFKSEARSVAKVDVAFYIVNDTYQYEDLKLDDIVPSNNPYVYNFTVSNNDGIRRTETKIKYDVEIVTTTNLPLTYDLYLNSNYNDAKAVSFVSSDNVIQDEDGTYFRTIKGATRYFSFDSDQIDNYQLVVYFPEMYSNYEYQNKVENIEIRIISSQFLESDK